MSTHVDQKTLVKLFILKFPSDQDMFITSQVGHPITMGNRNFFWFHL